MNLSQGRCGQSDNKSDPSPCLAAKNSGTVSSFSKPVQMASNVLVFSARRGPSFVLVASLVITVIIVFCNDMLLRDVSVLHVRLRVLAARELTSDKKGSALVTKLTKMQGENEKIEGVVKSKESEIGDARSQLQDKVSELLKLHKHEVCRLIQSPMHKFC